MEIAKVFGYNTNLIEQKSIKSVNFKARRPNNTTLNTKLLENTTGVVLNFFEGLKLFYTDYTTFAGKTQVHE